MKNLVDYTYYRLHKWYESLNDEIPDEGALAILTVMSVFLVLDLVALSMYFIGIRFQREYDLIYIASTLTIAGSIYLFYRSRYKRIRPEEFTRQWADEPHSVKLRNGILITVAFFMLIFIPFWFGGRLLE